MPLVSSLTVTEVIRAPPCNPDTNHWGGRCGVLIPVEMPVSVPVIASLSMARPRHSVCHDVAHLSLRRASAVCERGGNPQLCHSWILLPRDPGTVRSVTDGKILSRLHRIVYTIMVGVLWLNPRLCCIIASAFQAPSGARRARCHLATLLRLC